MAKSTFKSLGSALTLPKRKTKAPPASSRKGNTKKHSAVCIKTKGEHIWSKDKDGEFCSECLEDRPKVCGGKKAKTLVEVFAAEEAAVAPTAEELAAIEADGAGGLVPGAKPKKGRKPKAKPPTAKTGDGPKAQKDAKLSQIDAAAVVLKGAKAPLSAKEICERMEAKGLWSSPGGKTPDATLSAAIGKEISQKGKDSRFAKPAPGRFALA